jgi:hypothetical protein
LFDTQDFIDTTETTATWIEPSAGTTGSYDLTTGEIVQSEIIAKRPTAFTTATVTVEGTGLDDLDMYLSQDDTNWEEVTNNTSHIFTNTGTSGIKYKIVASDTANITSITIKYI